QHNLWFTGRTSFEVQKDGKVLCELIDAHVHHLATWKSSDGASHEYRFDGAGCLKATGQFKSGALAIRLEWQTGDGTGISLGKTVTQSVMTEPVVSKWELKPTDPWPEAIPEWRRKALTYFGRRESSLPRLPAEWPSSPLSQQLLLVKAPKADLEVVAKAGAES